MGGQWQANSGRQAGMQRRRHQEEQRQRDQQNRLALLGGRACLIVLALACGQQLAGRVELTLTDFGICRPPLSLPPPLQRCCCATTARPQIWIWTQSPGPRCLHLPKTSSAACFRCALLAVGLAVA